MRILQIMAGATNGGAETYSTDVMASLHAEGIEQVLVVPRQSIHHERLSALGTKMAPEVLDAPLMFLQKMRLKKLIASYKPDLVHCWMRRAATLTPMLDVPVIGWFGGYYEPKHFVSASYFVGVTKDIVAHQVTHGVAPDRAFYVPTFPTIESALPVERAALDTRPDQRAVLALSRLHEKKGLDVLLKAAVSLPDVVLWIAGDGPLEADLKALAVSLGVADRVRWLGWRTDRGALLAGCDICVMPSRWEPFGTVMLEAWAAERPLVVAAAQGPKATIRDGENGLMVPIDDVAALAQALRRAIDDKPLAQRMVANGLAEYRSTFTREAVTAQMLALYRTLISRHGSGRTQS
ncbi:MAG: glycosyltransferase [Hyphomicrobiaceae bacterium]